MVAERDQANRKPRVRNPRISGSNGFLLLGRTVVPEPTLFGTAFVPLTADTFRFWRAKSPEHLQRLHERIAEIERTRQEFGSCAIPEGR